MGGKQKKHKKTDPKRQKHKTQPVRPVKQPLNQSRQHMLLVALLLIAVFMAYLPVLNKEFINYDDDLYIYNHPLVKNFSFSNIPEIFGSFYYAQYSPIPTMIYGLLHMISGFKPFLFNISGLLLHLAVVFLVFRLIRELGKNFRISIITAALFGLATIQVEAVAWSAAVFKTAGYSIFFLLSLIMYIRYVRTAQQKFIVISLLLFVLSFLCKEQSVALSLAVVAIDLYLGRKLLSKKVLLEKIPYFVISIVCGLIALAAARSFNEFNATPFGFFERIIYACYAICNYLFKTLIPVKLAMFYAYPSLKNISYIYFLYPLIVVAIIALWIIAVKKKQRYILFGGLFFFFNILFSLVLQVISVREVVMADRYMYMASIGIFFMMAVFADTLIEKNKIKSGVVFVFFIAYLLFFGILTHLRAGTWKNSVSMYTELLKFDNRSELAYRNRGNFYRDEAKLLAEKGNYARAKEYTDLAFNDYSRLIEVSPDNTTAYVSRGKIYTDRKMYDKALEDFNMAIELGDKDAETYSNRGAAHGFLNKPELSLEDFNTALKINPKSKNALRNRSVTFYNAHEFEKAIADLNTYLELVPDDADSYNLRALCKANIKDYKGALEDFNTAININPKQGLFYQNRAFLYESAGDKTKMIEDLETARRLGIDIPQAYMDKLKK
ncbi:MAG: tetratricopeptide repeat protein [Bacteroidales bacterium]|jgi:tetratricopeptide (TPR) repeat protein|nr:tetratricopeptide repeat protein [Bacteroidales bacterium]MDD4213447.1 tetratricopeptide repeat protein [Bacteroidales bacterium]